MKAVVLCQKNAYSQGDHSSGIPGNVKRS